MSGLDASKVQELMHRLQSLDVEVQALGNVLADHLVGGAKLANDRLVVARRLAYPLDGALDGHGLGDGSVETKSISDDVAKRQTHHNARDFQKKKNRHTHEGARI